VVRQSPGLDCLVIWNVANDYEEDAYDRKSSAKLIFDSKGSPYIAENDIITVCD